MGIALNVGFVALEAAFGAIAGSTALLADAAHNLGDVLGLMMAWGAAALARRAPVTSMRTYGLRRSTVLAALANAVLLLFAVGAVALEAIGRFGAPVSPDGPTMIWVAAAGVCVNGLSAWLLRAAQDDLNMRGAFLHLIADATVSASVMVAGVAVWLWGSRWIDPVTSLLVSAIILYGTWDLLRDAVHLAMDGVPRSIDLEQVRGFLAELPHVTAVHDLHVWAMSTTEVALTAHLVMPWQERPPTFLAELHHQI